MKLSIEDNFTVVQKHIESYLINVVKFKIIYFNYLSK